MGGRRARDHRQRHESADQVVGRAGAGLRLYEVVVEDVDRNDTDAEEEERRLAAYDRHQSGEDPPRISDIGFGPLTHAGAAKTDFAFCRSRSTPATKSASSPIAAGATWTANTLERQAGATAILPAPALCRATAAAIATATHARVATTQTAETF